MVYESYFSATGWCKRPLDVTELCLALELPEFVEWDWSFGSDLILLQLGRAVMEEVIVQIGVRMPESAKPRKRVQVSVQPDIASVDHHLIPDLGKWMPGSWADTEISDRAVKADGASIDFFPWNQRITLVLPRVSSHLITLMENMCHSRWCLTLSRSFLAFMKARHGPDWGLRLRSARSRVSRAGGDRLEGFAPALPKRQRVNSNPIDRGVCRVGGGGKQGGREEEEEGELVTDATKGAKALSQLCQSSWWEWKNGSSLVFWRWNGSEQIRSARDGMDIFVAKTLPRDTKALKPPRIPEADLKLVAAKVDVILQRGYLEEGPVRSRVHYFAVPKGNKTFGSSSTVPQAV